MPTSTNSGSQPRNTPSADWYVGRVTTMASPGSRKSLHVELDALLGAVAHEDVVRRRRGRPRPGDAAAIHSRSSGRPVRGAYWSVSVRYLTRRALRELRHVRQALGIRVARPEQDHAGSAVTRAGGLDVRRARRVAQGGGCRTPCFTRLGHRPVLGERVPASAAVRRARGRRRANSRGASCGRLWPTPGISRRS